MAGAVHGFQCEFLLFHFEWEHVLLVMLPMAGGLPQFRIVNVWRDDLLEATLPVFLLQEFDQRVVDVCAARQEEARTRRKFVEKEQFLFTADFAMVSFGCFFLEFLPFFELFRVGEWDTVHTLQCFCVRFTFPVTGGVLKNRLTQCHVLFTASMQIHHSPL